MEIFDLQCNPRYLFFKQVLCAAIKENLRMSRQTYWLKPPSQARYTYYITKKSWNFSFLARSLTKGNLRQSVSYLSLNYN